MGKYRKHAPNTSDLKVTELWSLCNNFCFTVFINKTCGYFCFYFHRDWPKPSLLPTWTTEQPLKWFFYFYCFPYFNSLPTQELSYIHWAVRESPLPLEWPIGTGPGLCPTLTSSPALSLFHALINYSILSVSCSFCTVFPQNIESFLLSMTQRPSWALQLIKSHDLTLFTLTHHTSSSPYNGCHY